MGKLLFRPISKEDIEMTDNTRQGTADQNHIGIPLHMYQNGYNKKDKQSQLVPSWQGNGETELMCCVWEWHAKWQ